MTDHAALGLKTSQHAQIKRLQLCQSLTVRVCASCCRAQMAATTTESQTMPVVRILLMMVVYYSAGHWRARILKSHLRLWTGHRRGSWQFLACSKVFLKIACSARMANHRRGLSLATFATRFPSTEICNAASLRADRFYCRCRGLCANSSC